MRFLNPIKDREIEFKAELYELENMRDNPCASCRYYDEYAGCIYPDDKCVKEKAR